MEPLSWLVNFFTEFGYWAVFGILIACGFGLPIPEDISLVAGGIISGLHFTKLSTMILTGMAGVLIGDGIVFTIGRFYGQRVFSLPLIRKLMTPDRFTMVQSKFTKYGNWVLFAARFMPGFRTPIFLTAGASRKVSFLRFFVLDGAAALISVPVWVYLGYLGADNREWLMQMVKRGQTLTFGVIGLALIVAIIIFLVRRRTQKQCQT
jgi:membrane protein DedA with SNARE-associated domain